MPLVTIELFARVPQLIINGSNLIGRHRGCTHFQGFNYSIWERVACLHFVLFGDGRMLCCHRAFFTIIPEAEGQSPTGFNKLQGQPKLRKPKYHKTLEEPSRAMSSTSHCKKKPHGGVLQSCPPAASHVQIREYHVVTSTMRPLSSTPVNSMDVIMTCSRISLQSQNIRSILVLAATKES